MKYRLLMVFPLVILATSCQSTKPDVSRELLINVGSQEVTQNVSANQSVPASPAVETPKIKFDSKASPGAKTPIKLPSDFYLPRASNGQIPNDWTTFKDDSIVENYINRKPINFVIGDLKRSDLDQLTSLDIMKALTEATLVENNGLYISINFIAGKDPNELTGKYGKLGNFNSGGDNKNSFTDRPDDSQIDPILVDSLRIHTDTTVEQMVAFANDNDLSAIRRVFFQARIPLYYWLANASTEQSKVKLVMDQLKANNLYDSTSTTFKAFVIDQVNQMGPGGIAKSDGQPVGVKVLIEHIVKQREVLKTKQEVLNHFVKIGAVGNDYVFVTVGGDRVNLNSIPEELLRFFLARVTYFSDGGPLGEFKMAANASWLTKAHDTPVKGALQDILRRGSKVPRSKADFDRLDKEKKGLFNELSSIFQLSK
ncbi:MAG: hypothetical protein ACRCXZ_04235 [Patescibacteria group bacterium]